MTLADKFIGYVDLLGFTQLVELAETGVGRSAAEINDLARLLGSPAQRNEYEEHGPIICPESAYINRNLDFRLTQITDCIIVSAEISPAGIINLVQQCWIAVFRVLKAGYMCRGYITKGKIFHIDGQFFGSGYLEAVNKEKGVAAFKRHADERGTPFVEIDPVVSAYIRDCDACVKEMYERFVRTEGNVDAIFPFQALAHSFMLGGFGSKFEPERERASIDNMRKDIKKLMDGIRRSVDPSNVSAVRKSEHYLGALEAQLRMCDESEDLLGALEQPLGGWRARGRTPV
jgi:hypothetical protein